MFWICYVLFPFPAEIFFFFLHNRKILINESPDDRQGVLFAPNAVSFRFWAFHVSLREKQGEMLC